MIDMSIPLSMDFREKTAVLSNNNKAVIERNMTSCVRVLATTKRGDDGGNPG